MSKIIIDPTSRILYASFYIEGLYQVFGKKNVTFSAKYFSDLKREKEAFAFEHYFHLYLSTLIKQQNISLIFVIQLT